MRRSLRSLGKAYSEIPGPPQWPIVGSFLDFKKHGMQIHRVHKTYYREYGPMVRQNLFGTEEVIVYDPREYLKVFQSEGKYPTGFVGDLWMVHMATKDYPYKSFVSSQGPEWAEKRQRVQKDVMSPRVAASYLSAINSTAEKVSQRIEELAAASPERRVDFKQLSSFVAFDLFCSAALGYSLNTVDPARADPRDLQFVADSCGALDRTLKLHTKPWAKHLPCKEYTEMKEMLRGTHRRGQELVSAASEELRRSGSVPDDEGPVVHRMLARGLEEEVVVAELAGLLGGSVDTTQHVLLWIFLNLATHASVQDRLAGELAQVLGGEGYTKEKKDQLVYMKAVIRESHRRNHTNPLITMRRLEKDISLGGYDIPAGMRITFNGADMQQDPAIVDEPESFRPERFLPEEVEARKGDPVRSIVDHNLLATPFGFGARMCIGARLAENEIWALTSRLFQDFEFRLDPPDQKWEITMPFMTIATPYPTFKVLRRR